MRSLLGVGSTPRYGLPSLKCTSPTSRFWQNQQRQFHRSPRFVIPALTLVPCTMKCNVLLSQIYLSFFPPSIVHSLATNPHKILYESTEKSSQNIVRFPNPLAHLTTQNPAQSALSKTHNRATNSILRKRQNFTADLHQPSVSSAPRPDDHICIVGAGPAGEF